MKPIIEIRNLSKTFKSKSESVVALSNINLSVSAGDIYGIIGLSGAGKSTLVRCMNLLERPTEGDVLFDGQNLVTMKKKDLLLTRRKIGMIFQSFNLLAQRNCLQNVLFPFEIAKVPKKEAVERATNLLELVGLKDRIKAYPAQLSGGQKQRVAIARALAGNPKVLLCDEATSALDPSTTDSILELLRDINKKIGVTLIIITHEMRVVESICNRVAVIDKSKIVEEGAVLDVFTAPRSDMAKQLILPRQLVSSTQTGATKTQKCLRLVFNENSSTEPVIAMLATDLGIRANILFANTRSINGKPVGQMVIDRPASDEKTAAAIAYLTQKHITVREEIINA